VQGRVYRGRSAQIYCCRKPSKEISQDPPEKWASSSEKHKKFTQTFVNRLMNEVTRETKTSKTKHFDTQLSPTFAMQMSNSCGQNNGAQQNPQKTAVVKGFLIWVS